MTGPVARTRNITAAFRAASDADRAAGIEWYARARRLAEELDPNDVERAAAVIAVLSPRLAWHVNVSVAREAYWWRHYGFPRGEIAPKLPALQGNARKADALLWGADPEDVVSGPKVRAFWRTIADPTDPRAVVVDRHALDVAVGRVLDDRTRGAILGRAGAYDGVCELYRRAAKILSRETGSLITPAQVQAVTWIYWRRERAAGQAALVR